jgi:hypothetical protein
MDLSSEIFSAVLRRLIHREMYDLKFSPVLYTHRRNSSNDVGRREVPQKLAMNACRNSSQERMLSGARLFNHTLALSFKCSDSNWRALSLDPPPIVMGGHEVIEPNSRVLLPIVLDYTIAKLDPFRQWCGMDQEAKALRSAQTIVITDERFQIMFLLKATRIASCTSVVDPVLSQTMLKLPIDRFHHLSSRHDCWRCCWVSGLFDWRDGSSWYRFAPLVSCALKHPNSFEGQIPQIPHMLIIVGCVRSKCMLLLP